MEKFINTLKNFFDDFVFWGRIVPVLTILLPLIACGIIKGYISKENIDFALYGGAVVFAVMFMAKIARRLGKNFEEKMYKELGAKPTTIVLRYSDSTIDILTKTRYHKYINEKIKGMNLPLTIEEENDSSDIFYESAMVYLKKYANSNRDSEQRVYQELKEYNYWRNLYGCKWGAIIIYGVIALREVYLIKNFSIKEIIFNTYPNYIVFIIMLLGIMIMCVCVNKKIVKQRAFEYAKSLAETCERFVEE